jgi:hypothetical protein
MGIETALLVRKLQAVNPIAHNLAVPVQRYWEVSVVPETEGWSSLSIQRDRLWLVRTMLTKEDKYGRATRESCEAEVSGLVSERLNSQRLALVNRFFPPLQVYVIEQITQ